MIKHKTGDATSPRPGTKGVIIAHCCNSLGLWGAGFVKALSKMSMIAESAYLGLARDYGFNLGPRRGDTTTLAQIPIGEFRLVEVLPNVWVANMVAQRGTNSFDATGNKRLQKVNVDGGINEDLMDYDALEKCLDRLFCLAASLDCNVHFPDGMGSGLAGGDKSKIHDMIKIAYEGRTPIYGGVYEEVFDVTLWEFADVSAASSVAASAPVDDDTPVSVEDA